MLLRFVLLLALSLTSLTGSSSGLSYRKSHKTDVVLTEQNTLVFRGPFTQASVAAATLRAKKLDSLLPSKDPIYLVIDSPGGSIDAGIEFKENLNSLNRPVITLTQFSASMGFHTVQSVLGERLVLADGTLMSHRAKGTFSGEFPGQLDVRRAFYQRRIDRLDQATIDRTKGKQTKASYAELIRDEYWCDGQDCVDAGFADRVVTASCDQSLSGVEVSELSLEFMGMILKAKANIARCPLITGAVGGADNAVTFTVNGLPASKEMFLNVKPLVLGVYVSKQYESATQLMTGIINGTYRSAVLAIQNGTLEVRDDGVLKFNQ